MAIRNKKWLLEKMAIRNKKMDIRNKKWLLEIKMAIRSKNGY